MQSELNGTKNLNLPPPAAETQGEVMLTEPANSYKETSASRKRMEEGGVQQLERVQKALKKAIVKCLKLIAAIVHTCCVQTIFVDTRCRW